MCYRSDISGRMGIVGTQLVEIAYPPQVVTEIQCIWYNWRDMLECSWELPAYNLRDIEVKLMWYNGAFGQCPDMSPNMTKCTLRPSYAALDVYSWHFQVTVTNTRRNVSAVGPFIAKNQLENVKPDKVDRLNYEYTDNSGCIRLTWTCEAVTCVSPSRKKQIRVRYVTLPGEPK
ncbi:uncharacterized protein LOC117318365, partial [Pecten maximus]|uniref:uncharacterized protein LOC117318365 n=1 Tax=Pecten maximus TaxID=6579 RepID=UPI00145851B4